MFRLLLLTTIFSFAVCAPVDDRDRRILGDTSPGQMRQFQYLASLRRTGTNPVHLGGGVLISELWVLSASSLTSLFVRPTDLVVALGIVNVGSAVIAPGMTSIAQEIRTQDQLALIRVQAVACNAARFGFISPIYMEPAVQPNVVPNALVAGWGLTTAGATTQLRFRNVPTVDTCANETSLCTTGALCNTDVGGPLVTASGLIGIATSATCGGTDLYARISFYRMWIHVVTGI